MAGKHKKERVARAPSKHQISRWEREKRLSRIIMIITAAIIVAVAGIIGVWIYTEQVMPYREPVIKVNDRTFSMDYFIKMLDAYTKGQGSDMVKYYTDFIVQAIPQTELLIENASASGITLSDDDVKKELDALKLTADEVNTDMAKARIVARKYNEQQCMPAIPASVEQVEVQAMLLENSKMADDRRQKILMGDNFSTIATQLSLDKVTKSKGGYLGWIPKGYESSILGDIKDSMLKDIIFKLDVGTVSEPTYDGSMEKPYGYWIVEVLDKDESRGIHGRGILCATETDAELARQKLLAGESWDAVAKEYSQHSSKDKGGDLDWLKPGVDEAHVGRILSTMESNKISPPTMDSTVKTKGGYWLVMVLDKQQRALPDSIKQTLSEECLSTWIQGMVKNAKVDTMINPVQKEFAAARVIKSRSK